MIDVEDWYRRYGPMVLRRCRTLLRDEAAALDAMHDVFVEILRRATRLEVRGASSYLWRTATHVSLNVLRSQKTIPVDDNEALLLEIAGLDDVESQVSTMFTLDRIFARETPSTRVIATLFHVDGLTLEEVAATVGMSVSGVRKRLRTLQLRARLARSEAA